jgi:hypothetical protein
MSNTLLSEDRESKALLFTNSESNELLEYMLDTESYNMTGGMMTPGLDPYGKKMKEATQNVTTQNVTAQTIAKKLATAPANQKVAPGSVEQITATEQQKTAAEQAAQQKVEQQEAQKAEQQTAEKITKEKAEELKNNVSDMYNSYDKKGLVAQQAAQKAAQEPTNILMNLFNDLGITDDNDFNNRVNKIVNNDKYDKNTDEFKKINSKDRITQIKKTQEMIEKMKNAQLSDKYKKMVSNLIKIQVYSTFTKKDVDIPDYTKDFDNLIQLVNDSLDSTSNLMESELKESTQQTQQGGGKVNTINKYLKYKLKYMLLKMD